ncbi:NAD-dependent epimerase/dehydratase family protein [Novosphingopyxis sp.]|uniref:NAD-dependent epimerase/dehydratase family protein n=1 Tax=Novosphingopyxis sp. TaxID=2709690 RepID=UPI003B598023
MTDDSKPVILITGVSGEVGEAIVGALGDGYTIVGMDQAGKSASVPIVPIDLTEDASVAYAFETFRDRYGGAIASVIHLAGYFDFTGEDDPLYHTLNVAGTRRLMEALKPFRVGQIAYAGTMLVHAAVSPGEHLDEERRLDPQWIYPQSKLDAEDVIRAEHGVTPFVLFHLAGLYSEKTVVPTLAHQIARIYERDLESHVYPGNRDTGQSMVHHADMADAFRRAVDRRADLPEETVILVGEPDPIGYAALQDRLGELVHGEQWATIRIPQIAAATGAWVEEKVLPHLPKTIGGGKEPFIRPFMAWQGSDHYALDIRRAKTLLCWSPSHHLTATLPEIVDGLKRDPETWYKANGIVSKSDEKNG